ncbi:MAG: oligopeptide/dipeptide ABC transporter ATP-binding protein, partial [Candidatus Nanopelagicales bacterium]
QVLNDPQHPYTKALLSVVPEMEQVEPIVLTGETPDPTKIPSGCRFHPRCQAFKNGEAERAGILDLCVGTSPSILPPDATQHVAACHLVNAPAQADNGSALGR